MGTYRVFGRLIWLALLVICPFIKDVPAVGGTEAATDSLIDVQSIGLLSLTRIANRPIWHAHFDRMYNLAMSFGRAQEYYESPTLRGQVFDWEELMDSDAARNGHFTYTKDWAGFNLPDNALRDFRMMFAPFSRREQAFLSVLEQAGVFSDARFYVIGTSVEAEGKDDDPNNGLKHETLHGLFYLEPAYNTAASAAVRDNWDEGYRQCLEAVGYGDTVMVDEMQAYAQTGWLQECHVSNTMLRLEIELRRIAEPYLQ